MVPREQRSHRIDDRGRVLQITTRGPGRARAPIGMPAGRGAARRLEKTHQDG